MRQLLKRQRLTRETALNTKTIKPHTEERTVHLHTTTLSYLLMPLINVGPVAGIKAISVANVANLTSEATVPAYGRTCNKCKGPNHFKTMCHSKVPDRTAKSPYKKPQQQQPRRTSTSSNGKGGGKQFFKKKTPKKHPPKQKAYKVTFKPKTVLKETSGGENAGNVSNSVLSGKGS